MHLQRASSSKTMQQKTTNISVRHWLRNGLALLLEALIWTLCLHAATKQADLYNADGVTVRYALCILYYIVAAQFIPTNTFSRTARRDEIVACAMKTALIVCATAVIFFLHHFLMTITFILFAIALTAERLILNSWFIRYAMHHPEHGVLVCGEDTAWQQQALQQNTYGLKLARLEGQTAHQLEEYLEAHPEAESVYCTSSSLLAAELEDIAHTCRKQGLALHFLPQPVPALNKAMLSECRGNVSVLSPAKLPLDNILCRTVKRMTDIVISLFVLLTFFPVFALLAFICIKRQSRGPVLVFRHMCGMDGKTFQCLTFRTRHYEAAPSFFDGTGDPGYFPFGKFLKRSKLELLPQFLCVLWGSMTIVGSQMIRPEQYADYRRELRQLFTSNKHLKAGITSHLLPSQSKGSTKADVWYYHNWSLWLDLRIMLQRLGTLLSNSKAKSINYI